jgi:hypothetical protein
MPYKVIRALSYTLIDYILAATIAINARRR